jgi:hypothetical protein
MNAAQFTKQFGLTPAQASILLRAYENSRHNLKHKPGDRDKSVAVLNSSCYFEYVRDFSDEEFASHKEKMQIFIKQAHELLTASYENWQEAKTVLNRVACLSTEMNTNVRRLTTSGVELAKRITDAGHTSHKLWLGKLD